MSKIKIYDKITKDYLYQFISQQDIMEFYLGVNVVFDQLIESPLRPDSSPTCGFKYNDKNILRFKDFAGYFWGDCFDVVAYRINQNQNILKYYDINYVDSNNPKGFGIILDVIARDFKLGKYSGRHNLRKTDYIKPTPDKNKFKHKKEKSVFNIETRNWNYRDRNYWSSYYLSKSECVNAHIYPLQALWSNGLLIYDYKNDDDIGYAYYFGQINGINQFKIYFPNRKEYKFLSNTDVIQGLNILEKDKEFVIITKSYKDVICLKSFGISAIAPSSETNLISPVFADNLYKWFDYVFSLMDYDRTGVKMSIKLLNIYGISPLFFTDYPLKRKNFKQGFRDCKDFSDYLKKYGVDETQKLINYAYKENIGKHNEQINNLLNSF